MRFARLHAGSDQTGVARDSVVKFSIGETRTAGRFDGGMVCVDGPAGGEELIGELVCVHAE